jgi:phenylacetate-CoA ligase
VVGRTFAIARVDGRSDDILHVPGIDGEQVAVHPHHLRAPFTRLPDVSQYQVVYDGLRLKVRVVLRQATPPDMIERVRGAIAAQVEAVGAAALPVDVEPVAEIEREPGQGAKLKLVVSEVAAA